MDQTSSVRSSTMQPTLVQGYSPRSSRSRMLGSAARWRASTSRSAAYSPVPGLHVAGPCVPRTILQQLLQPVDCTPALLAPSPDSTTKRSRCPAPSAAAMRAGSFTNPPPPAPGFEERFIEVAEQLADAAARVTRKYFRSPFDVETKADASPVTIADKQAETAMRDLLSKLLPEHGVFGEEHGLTWGSGAGAEYMWVLDPIDGTKSFITGKPLFGTLVSLLYRGQPVLGVIDQPILRERWLGVAGRQTTLNGAPISTRQCPQLSLAYLYATTPHMFSGATEVAFNRIRDAVRIPMYGCDCYAYGLLAAGYADLVVEADLKPYDYMALVPVVKGAGGVITDWEGNELRWHPQQGAEEQALTWPGEVLAAGDVRCHTAALNVLAYKRQQA